MNRKPLPYPPQMGNGGSPPAHLRSSSLSGPLAWLQHKWSQPPPLAPNWVFDVYQKFNPPANVGRPLCDEEWLQQAFCKDKQAAGILPPDPPGGPILLGSRACAERAYLDWKWMVNALWEDECHRLQMAARQRHLDEETTRQRQAAAAARARQEAARRQQLLDKQAARTRQEAAATRALQEAAATRALQEAAAARACQEAVRRQQLLDEEAARARCQEAARLQQLLDEKAARARQEAAAARARQETAAAAARARQEADDARARQEASKFAASMASLRAIMAELQRAAEALALVKERCRHDAVLAAEADDRRRHEAAARAAEALALDKERCRHKAVLAAKADNRRRHEVAARAAEALALDEERCRHEAVLVAEADDRHRREAVAHTKALAAKVLANERGGQESAVCAKVFAAQALAIATSLPPRPTLYAGAVLSTLGGSLLPAVLSSPPSPTTGSLLQV
jgi:hypothetical protein